VPLFSPRRPLAPRRRIKLHIDWRTEDSPPRPSRTRSLRTSEVHWHWYNPALVAPTNYKPTGNGNTTNAAAYPRQELESNLDALTRSNFLSKARAFFLLCLELAGRGGDDLSGRGLNPADALGYPARNLVLVGIRPRVKSWSCR